MLTLVFTGVPYTLVSLDAYTNERLPSWHASCLPYSMPSTPCVANRHV